MITVEEKIWEFAHKNANKIALKSGKSVVTYQQLMKCIVSAKEHLSRLPNFYPGKTIILAATKQIEFVFAYFGAHLAGLIVAPLDSECNQERLEHIINTIHPIYIIGFGERNIACDKLQYGDVFDNDDNIILNTPLFPQETNIADILFTTGTTGTPKGVPLSHLNVAAAVRNINQYIQNKENDVELLALPVSHSFGLGRLRCCLANGQTLIMLGNFVNTKKLFRVIEEEKVSGFSMVPASWKYIQKMTGDTISHYASQIKYIEMGSAYFSEEDKKQLLLLLPKTKLVMHYGLTEASRSAFLDFHSDKEYLNSVGKAAPYTDIQVFDNMGNLLPINTDGELCVKGDHVTSGYLNSSISTSFFGDAYFRTGDMGSIDSKGYIYLKSRIKELINVGGKKVAPIEVEERLLRIPGVQDCACVGVQDPDHVLGEVVKAFIVKDASVDMSIEDIRKALYGTLENYKLPALVEWIQKIPRTANGKIQRNLLTDD